MAKTFRGEWRHKVDGKGRVSVPAPFRKVLEAGDPDWAEGLPQKVVLLYGRQPGCLEGYTLEGAAYLDALVAKLPRFSPQKKALSRLISTQSVELDVDPGGRLVLSQALRDRVGIAGEAVFVGMTENFEIWSPEAYEADAADLEQTIAEEDGSDLYALLQSVEEKFGG